NRGPQLDVRSRSDPDGPPLPDQLVEPGTPALVRPEAGDGHQQVVQLVRVAWLRLRLLSNALDRGGIEPAQVPSLDREAPTELHRPAPALLQRRIVEEREGPPVQDLVSQHGRLH